MTNNACDAEAAVRRFGGDTSTKTLDMTRANAREIKKTKWNIRGWAIAMAIGLFGWLAPVEAWAGCTGSDRAGTWQIYALWTDGFESGWSKCTIKVTSGGNVKSGTTCTDKEAGTGATSSGNVQGGTIKLKSNCKISGNIKVAGCRNTITEGWISKDATMMSGVGKDCEGFIFRFNGIKS